MVWNDLCSDGSRAKNDSSRRQRIWCPFSCDTSCCARLDGTSDATEVPEDATHLNQAGNSGNLRDVGADQLGGLLVDVTLATLAVVLLEMGEGRSRRDWVHVAVPMIVE
jgi:hypothetical protein